MPDKPHILVIVGPTAVGKTELAIQLAKAIGGEIISCDSRLFYRGMDIGTAKPTLVERSLVTHYLIDSAGPQEVWSLSIFQKKANEAIQEILSRGKIPMLVGGTGQYVRAIIEGWEIPPQQPDEKIRQVLEQWGKQIGPMELHQKLRILDPIAAQKIDPQNLRRTIRALEVIYLTGERFSSQRKSQLPDEKYWLIGLNRPRVELYARIDSRIEAMFKDGLVEETESLLERGLPANHSNLSAIGYREVIEYLEGKISLEEAKARTKKKTREFVRRQANWFKPDAPNIHWYEMNKTTLETILSDLRVANIIR